MYPVDWLYGRALCKCAALVWSNPLDRPDDVLVALTALVMREQMYATCSYPDFDRCVLFSFALLMPLGARITLTPAAEN